jgi:hypothetical protein
MFLQLEEVQEVAEVPMVNIKPVKIGEIEDMPLDQFVDVIGVLDSCQDLGLITRRDGSEGKKRSLILRDDSGKSIEITLWGEKAEGVGAQLFECARNSQHPVLVVKGANHLVQHCIQVTSLSLLYVLGGVVCMAEQDHLLLKTPDMKVLHYGLAYPSVASFFGIKCQYILQVQE